MTERAKRPQDRLDDVVDRFVRLARDQNTIYLSDNRQPMDKGRDEFCLARAGRTLQQSDRAMPRDVGERKLLPRIQAVLLQIAGLDGIFQD